MTDLSDMPWNADPSETQPAPPTSKTASYADLLVMVAARDTEIERLRAALNLIGAPSPPNRLLTALEGHTVARAALSGNSSSVEMRPAASNLRIELQEWDRLADAQAVMRADSLTFGQVLTLRGNVMEKIIKAARAVVGGASPDETSVCHWLRSDRGDGNLSAFMEANCGVSFHVPVGLERKYRFCPACGKRTALLGHSPEEPKSPQGLKSIGFEPRGSQIALVMCFDSVENAQAARAKASDWIVRVPEKASSEDANVVQSLERADTAKEHIKRLSENGDGK